MKKLLGLIIVALILTPAVAFGGGEAEVADMHRGNTLYINGQQWGPPTGFNPLAPAPDWPIGGQENLVYENLFMYNMLTGEMEPLVATDMDWVDDETLEISIHPEAAFNDGEPLTAADVEYTFQLADRYDLPFSDIWAYLDDAVAVDDETIVLTLNPEDPNRLQVMESLLETPLLPEHVWSDIEDEHDGDHIAMRELMNDDPVASGPYTVDYHTEESITLVRNDDYWGVAIFGDLPAPTYIVHPIFESNDAGNLAFEQNRVDLSQQFIPNVWEMWEDGQPIRTYLDDEPYFVPGMMPALIVNVHRDGLDERNVRRAIAKAIDYERIGEVAMTRYSQDFIPSLLLQGEFDLLDEEAMEPYAIERDIDAAKALLDEIGAEEDDDGIRVLPDGTRLGPWEVQAPHGWTDWNAAIEIVTENAAEIGIELRSHFPDTPVWEDDLQTGSFDIIMDNPGAGPGPSQPWERSYASMYSPGVPDIGEVAYRNQGRFENERADEIIAEIPQIDPEDTSTLRELYTELNNIYLQELPNIPVMYRPGWFHTFNETYWEGFTREGDDTDIPPQALMGASIRDLYEITPVE